MRENTLEGTTRDVAGHRRLQVETRVGSWRAGRSGARPRDWVALAVLMLPTVLLSLDLTSTFVAIPTITEQLHASPVQQLWIMNIYGIAVAGFLVTMGKLGDDIGRRRLLFIGAPVFALISIATAFAPSPALLIAGRAAMGIAGATLAPSALALITNIFQVERQRALAFSIWGTSFMTGAAVGPLIGGALVEHLWWGAPFLLALPVAAILLAVGPFVLPEFRAPGRRRLDPVSIVLSLGAILPIVYGIQEIGQSRSPLPTAAPILAGIVVGLVFVRRQRRLSDPLIDVTLFANRRVTVALLALAAGPVAQAGLSLLVMNYLQSDLGFTPLHSGVWEVPGSIAQAASSLIAPLLIGRLPRGALLGGSLAVSAAGCVVIALGHSDPTTGIMLAGVTLLFIGLGPTSTLAGLLVVGSAPPERAGSAASLCETFGNIGMASGIAVLGTIAAFTAKVGIPAPGGLAIAALCCAAAFAALAWAGSAAFAPSKIAAAATGAAD